MQMYVGILLYLCLGVWPLTTNGADVTNETFRLETGVKEECDQVGKRLEKFEGSRECGELDGIPALIESIWDGNRQNDASWRSKRRLKLQLWLTSLDVVENSVDKNFNENDVPEENMAPPQLEGSAYDSGIRPDAIKDPELRAQYEEMLKQNANKAEYYRFQRNIRRYEKEWSRKINSYIKHYYSDTGEDQKEIKDIIDACIPDKVRNSQLKQKLLFGGSP